MDWLNNDSQNLSSERKDDESVQGSKAWLKWRGKGLGGSDAAVLLGWSPWKTVEQLYLEKCGLWESTFGDFQRSAMERGKQLEPVIRKWYEDQVGERFPEEIAEHPIYKFMRASFDGINRTFKNEDGSLGRILEIKAPNAGDHALAKEGMVPKKYLTQLMWMGYVANIEWFDYVSFGSDGTYARVTVKTDPILTAELVRRAQIFWQCYKDSTNPTSALPNWIYPLLKPIDLNRCGDRELDPPQISEQEIEALVAETLKAQADADQADAKFQALKEKLKVHLGDQEKMKCGEAVFGWQIRKGNVDYSKIEALKKIDLDQYRKDDIKAFYFKRST